MTVYFTKTVYLGPYIFCDDCILYLCLVKTGSFLDISNSIECSTSSTNRINNDRIIFIVEIMFHYNNIIYRILRSAIFFFRISFLWRLTFKCYFRPKWSKSSALDHCSQVFDDVQCVHELQYCNINFSIEISHFLTWKSIVYDVSK